MVELVAETIMHRRLHVDLLVGPLVALCELGRRAGHRHVPPLAHEVDQVFVVLPFGVETHERGCLLAIWDQRIHIV